MPDDPADSARAPVTVGTGRWKPAPRSQELIGLGPLEAAVMRIVWDRQRVNVRDVYEELRLRRRTAYTTVMTTLNNLARKGLLRKDRSAEAFVYTPAVTDVEVAKAVLDVVVESLMGGRVGPLVEYLQSKGR